MRRCRPSACAGSCDALHPLSDFAAPYLSLTPVITDPENPKFDLEKVIASWEKSA
jgi:hypothetical protein